MQLRGRCEAFRWPLELPTPVPASRFPTCRAVHERCASVCSLSFTLFHIFPSKNRGGCRGVELPVTIAVKTGQGAARDSASAKPGGSERDRRGRKRGSAVSRVHRTRCSALQRYSNWEPPKSNFQILATALQKGILVAGSPQHSQCSRCFGSGAMSHNQTNCRSPHL